MSPIVFWPRFAGETVAKHVRIGAALARLSWMAWIISRDARSKTYADTALTPVHDGDENVMDLFTKTAGGSAAVVHVKKIERLTNAARVG